MYRGPRCIVKVTIGLRFLPKCPRLLKLGDVSELPESIWDPRNINNRGFSIHIEAKK